MAQVLLAGKASTPGILMRMNFRTHRSVWLVLAASLIGAACADDTEPSLADPGSGTAGSNAGAGHSGESSAGKSSHPPEAGASGEAGSGAAGTGNAGSSSEGGTAGNASLLCAEPPPASVNRVTTTMNLSGTRAFAFTPEGRMVVADARGNLVYEAPNGTHEVWVKRAAVGEVSAMDWLPSGALVFVDSSGTLMQVTAQGGIFPVLEKVSFPARLVVDRDGTIILAEPQVGRIRQVDPTTGRSSTIAEDVPSPAGLAISPDRSKLFVSSAGTGIIYVLARDAKNGWSSPEEFARTPEAPGNRILEACAKKTVGDSCSDYRPGYECHASTTGLTCSAPDPCATKELGEECQSLEGETGTCQDIAGAHQCAPVDPCTAPKTELESSCTDAVGLPGRCTADPTAASPYCGMAGACDGREAGESCVVDNNRDVPMTCQDEGSGSLTCQRVDPCEGLSRGDRCTTEWSGPGICVDDGDTLYCEYQEPCQTAEDEGAGCTDSDGLEGVCVFESGYGYCRPFPPCETRAEGDACTVYGKTGTCTLVDGILDCRVAQPCDGLSVDDVCRLPHCAGPNAGVAEVASVVIPNECEGICEQRSNGELQCVEDSPCRGLSDGDSCVDPWWGPGHCVDYGDEDLYCEHPQPCDGKAENDSCVTSELSSVVGTCVEFCADCGLECFGGDACQLHSVGDACTLDGKNGRCMPGARRPECRTRGTLGALTVDACGMLYVVEEDFGTLFRISADGNTVEEITTLPTTSIGSAGFGRTEEGWNGHSLHLMDGGKSTLYSVPVGTQGPPVPTAANPGTGGEGGASDGRGGATGETGGSSSGEAGGGATTAEERCANLIHTAVTTTQVFDIEPIEDITFDDAGYLYYNTDDAIMRMDADGNSSVYIPDIMFAAGMRMTRDNVLYVGNNGEGTLERITADAVREVVMTDISVNGVEVDREGRAYVTDFGGTHVLRYDPKTRETTVLASYVSSPNGITLGTNFDVLYYNSWGDSGTRSVFRIPLAPDGTPSRLDNWANHLGTGTHDGMAVDECGHVYVANDGGAGQVVRINRNNPFDRVAVVERPEETLHNFVWGRGNGWPKNRLYVVSLGVGLFAADVGVEGKSYE